MEKDVYLVQKKKDFYVVGKIFLPLLEKDISFVGKQVYLVRKNISTLLEKDSHLYRKGKISAFIGKKRFLSLLEKDFPHVENRGER